MANFNASIRGILSEVDAFFNETLRNEKVSRKALLHKEKLLDEVHKLRQAYPELLSTSVGPIRIDADDLIPEVPARTLKDITKAGFLEKRRKKETLFHRGSYQRRYCVIQNSIFYYFGNFTDKKQAGAFSLAGYKFRKAAYLPEESHKKDLSFELSSPGKRSYQFLAENTQDFKEWKEAVEKNNSDSEKNNKKNNNKSEAMSTPKGESEFVKDDSDDDEYYVAVPADREENNNKQHDNDSEDDSDDGQNYEVVLPDKDVDRNGTKPESPKPPPVPKKTAPKKKAPKKTAKTSITNRAPMRPPPLPKQNAKTKPTADNGLYEDCDTKSDDDENYADPMEYGKESDEDFDDEENYDDVESTLKDPAAEKTPVQDDDDDLYYTDVISGKAQEEVTH
ncbi:src kinase-associated phosphoprotein 2-A-like [Haliotis rufescens]|uniref:src kinase-associated phosphoprotein 2-A-like n=1 Tax=Haliotis rufescens TaxID=6454 RepID=UPI001EAFF87B|nr:src kinase-associated phosphoprotein 2-A-like [Haliotis rufescens]